MKYQKLLFDVDDTILDFQATEKQALEKLFRQESVPFNEENYQRFKIMNRGLWARYEQGDLSRQAIFDNRFGLFFGELGQPVDGIAAEKSYRDFLDEGHDVLENSPAILAELSQKADLYVVTNGLAQTQYRRLEDSGLLPYFKDIFISGDMGFHKPMKEYFDLVFDKIPGFEPKDAVIIGDSLTSDIKGGKNAGIDTIWLNRTPSENRSENQLRPTYEIHHLSELSNIL